MLVSTSFGFNNISFRLVPSVLLTFVHDQPNEMGNYLKDELLMLIQDM